MKAVNTLCQIVAQCDSDKRGSGQPAMNRSKQAGMATKSIVVLLVGLVLGLVPFAEAQQPKKVPRLGYLAPGDAAGDSIRSEAIRLALRERGYIAGQNIVFEYRYAEGKRDRYPELAAELVGLKVDIIVATGGAG
jgi:putative ABC transport system substrate-binding protein